MTPAITFIKEEHNSFTLSHPNYNKTKNEKTRIIWGDSGYLSFETKLLVTFLSGIVAAFFLTLLFVAMSYQSMWLLLTYVLVPFTFYFILSLNTGNGIQKGIDRDFKRSMLTDEQMKIFLLALNQKTKNIYLEKWEKVQDIHLDFEMCSDIAEEDALRTHKEKILESLCSEKETHQ